MKLVIGNKNYSSWSLRPWLLMEHFGIAFEEIHIALSTPEMPELMEKHCPSKKVPTLHDDGVIIWDSLAICEYLNESYLDGRGYPDDVQERGVARALTAEMHAGFATVRTLMPMDIRAANKTYDTDNVGLAIEIQRIDEIWSADWSDKAGMFLFGDFGIVDCFFAPVAYRFRTFNVPLSDKAKAYQQALLALPTMQAWETAAKAETAVIENDNLERKK